MSKNNYRKIKRLVDVVMSVILLLILSPVFLIVAVLIYCTDKGPVIFKQERLGLHSSPFMIYKFRSMSTDAPVVPAKDIDAKEHTTKIGRLIRKTSIDELPQLLNILKGEMSFVGPRPLILAEGWILEKRKELGIDQLKPGLTGWAQVKDRQITDQDMKVAFESYYMENQSLWLDIRIMLMTILRLQGK
ncbi:sugar transferase [Proteiniclasticum sp. C24MP]|uniref:sugar transferase n=1 Tax=Proteiniclasticum sp. C24MP TaxID=3374101 RepID=UPI003754B297